MFVENTKYMFYIVLVFPVLVLFSLVSGLALKSTGLFGILTFSISMSALILGFLLYAKLPGIRSGKLFQFGTVSIPENRKWSYKLSIHLLIIYYFISIVLMSKTFY